MICFLIRWDYNFVGPRDFSTDTNIVEWRFQHSNLSKTYIMCLLFRNVLQTAEDFDIFNGGVMCLNFPLLFLSAVTHRFNTLLR